MRALRLCRGPARAVTVRPEAPAVSPAVEPALRRQPLAEVQRRTDALSERAGAAAAKMGLAGSCDRAYYTAESPILKEALKEQQPRTVPSCSIPIRVSRPRAAAPVEAVEPMRSLAELRTLPVSELKRMLSIRGVGTGGKTEKAELAEWVYQHQDLPLQRRAPGRDMTASSSTEGASTSLVEFRRMPVRELRRFLQERGVSEGDCTEKSDLVQWVYQHRDLPVLRKEDPRRRGGERRWTRGFGPGPGGDPYDMPREDKQHEVPKQEQLEGEEAQARLEAGEGAEKPLLLEGEEQQQQAAATRRWFLIALAGVGVVALPLVALAINDGQQAAADAERRRSKEAASGAATFVQGQPARS